MATKVLAVIPARYASTRFPGKVLHPIAGKSMIARVYERVKQAQGLADILVATDDERVAGHVQALGGRVVMTDPAHPSGTDRCFEALQKSGAHYDYVLNIQGDEPFIVPGQIEALIALIDEAHRLEIATLIKQVERPDELTDTGEVKVVLNTRGEALYFSRYPVPFVRDMPLEEAWKHYTFYKHVGLYLYRSDILEVVCRLSPSMLERAESLEQLRWLEHGYRIHTAITTHDSVCVETPEDVQKVEQMLADGRLR
ncbi:MAG: 3-deoxy-manno-octulosonate cytidylyltransferase [Thermonema sp.]|uniref:3-deoxy-manno-octulosonate cytidylyltransferase n=1 Tax=Thermonema sp. TaxID=2231181 RepID=UPI0021DF072C|nr:3-deoxy-manno-octulosonate cytidylyltransferase [Thermonema sp.]GIV40632.1 MAG: 3-deoxy-manno-octulosonate cytidylyltransferase [Thermonema sp.]